MSGFFTKNNGIKLWDYCKRNGIKATYYAILEKLEPLEQPLSSYAHTTKETLEEQTKRRWQREHLISILVPTYETKENFLVEMIDSVLAQSYRNFELILADASSSDKVEKVVQQYFDNRIRYIRLETNGGISENTNQALAYANGSYIGLLDHDDLLAPDALYYVADAIEQATEQEVQLKIIYSNEDKCDETGETFFEYHKKEDGNLELLLSNNYICHFLVVEARLMKELKFRKAFDGAQDFDFVLRACHEVRHHRNEIVHIPRNLYHWRCHQESTASNTKSKAYAYEAGKNAVEDYMKSQGWMGSVTHSKHLGFYEIEYTPSLLEQRKEIGAIGGCLIDRDHTILSGNYTPTGRVKYRLLHKNYSGYMNRAVMRQEAWAVDIRLMKIQKVLRASVMEFSKGRFYMNDKGRVFLQQAFEEEQIFEMSQQICDFIREKGYFILWDPKWKETIRQVDKGEKNGSNSYCTKL